MTYRSRGLRVGEAVGALLLAALCCVRAAAAEIVLETSAVDKLVKQSIFVENGRHYLAKGACYAYLEQPTTTLRGGRVWIRAHLSSRLGIDRGTDCIGASFATWIVSSGRPVAAGSAIGLEDVRIDSVEDQAARAVIDGGLLPALPSAVNLDLKASIEHLLEGAVRGVQSTVDSVTVRSVTVVDDKRLSVAFDFKLTAR